MTKRQLFVAFTLVMTLATSAFAQSTDEARPTPITSNVLTGTLRGSETYVYSLKSRRGTTVRVRAELTVAGDGSQGFSMDFRGRPGVTGGQTNCCEGETYMSLSSEPTLTTSFRMITDEKFLMFLNFSAPDRPLPYRITFEGLNFDAEPVADDRTIIVPGISGNRWVDTGINVRRGDRVRLSAIGTVDASGSWGTHDANGTTRFARVAGYPVNSPRRYGLAAKIGAQKWAYSTADVRALRAGRLFLTVNDDSPLDNNGKFVVKVTVTPGR